MASSSYVFPLPHYPQLIWNPTADSLPMSLNLSIEDNSFQNGVVGGKCKSYPSLPLLSSSMQGCVEGIGIDCCPLFSCNKAYRIFRLPFSFSKSIILLESFYIIFSIPLKSCDCSSLGLVNNKAFLPTFLSPDYLG